MQMTIRVSQWLGRVLGVIGWMCFGTMVACSSQAGSDATVSESGSALDETTVSDGKQNSVVESGLPCDCVSLDFAHACGQDYATGNYGCVEAPKTLTVFVRYCWEVSTDPETGCPMPIPMRHGACDICLGSDS